MALQTFRPCLPLQPYIHMFWHWDNYAVKHPKERILPNGLMELTINLSDRAFNVNFADGSTQSYNAILVGFRSQYFVIDTSTPTTILSVLFKPGGILPFVNTSAKDLYNQIIGLDDIWGQDADRLVCRLLESSSTIERFRILEDMLLCRLDEQYSRHYAVDTALDLFSSSQRDYSIAHVRQLVDLSPPRFIQVFRDEVGTTPKMFTRLQRFSLALQLIANCNPMSWADIALRCGYYDQSHMINEFRSLAGIAPSTYDPQDPQHNFNIPFTD